jgi:hypothetical protein
MQYSNFIFSFLAVAFLGDSLETNRTCRTLSRVRPVSAGLVHERNARTLLDLQPPTVFGKEEKINPSNKYSFMFMYCT